MHFELRGIGVIFRGYVQSLEQADQERLERKPKSSARSCDQSVTGSAVHCECAEHFVPSQ